MKGPAALGSDLLAVPVSPGIVEELKKRTTLMKATEVAELFAVHPKTIYRWAARHELPSVRWRKSVRFDPKQLVDCITRKLSVPAYSHTAQGRRSAHYPQSA